MMSHVIEPDALAEHAALTESCGATVVYVVDLVVGALVPRSAAERVRALREALVCEVGFHAHNNLGCAVGNVLAAVEAGGSWVGGLTRGGGPGAGNAPPKVPVAALQSGGQAVRADPVALMDLAEEVLRQPMPREHIIDAKRR